MQTKAPAPTLAVGKTAEGDIRLQTDSSDTQISASQGRIETISEQVFLLEEASRPGEWMPAYEDEHGTYIMNSRDLRAIQHVQRLIDMGVHSLKIEGRTKSPFYVARTAQLYRQAITDAQAGRDFDMHLMDQLEGLANRGYTEGFYRRHPPAEYQNYEHGSSQRNTQTLVGEILSDSSDPSSSASSDRPNTGSAQSGWLTVEVKNRFGLGDTLELMTPNGNRLFKLESLRTARNHSPIEVAPGSGHVVQIPCIDGIQPELAMLIRHHNHAS
jgi:putative protease